LGASPEKQVETRLRSSPLPAANPILEALGQEPTSIDELVAKTGLPSPEVSSTLLRLELRGCVRQLPGMIFASRVAEQSSPAPQAHSEHHGKETDHCGET
ncbi:MAG: helix-turn-helix domain-containing protein, partial [Verrucomicrobiota bacterium]